MNEEYWYRRFWDGALLVPGWRSRSQEILRSVPALERGALEDRLQRLGEVIGREWARDNGVRRIDSARLESWGARLQGSSAGGCESVLAALDEIEDELDSILL